MNRLLQPKVLTIILVVLFINLMVVLGIFAWRARQKRLAAQPTATMQATVEAKTTPTESVTASKQSPESTPAQATQATATVAPTVAVAEQPPSAAAVIANGDFGSGDLKSWEVAGEAQGVVNAAVEGGKAAHFTGGNTTLRQKLSLGNRFTYTLLSRFKCNDLSGGSWGHVQLRIIKPPDWEKAIIEKNSTQLEAKCGDNQWHKLAVSFRPTSPGDYTLEIGTFGDRSKVDLFFSDLKLLERAGQNGPPAVQPQADATTGTVPFTVTFKANENDLDGAVDYYAWNFGDGGEARTASPSHTFYQRGTYPVAVTVWDNEGATGSGNLSIEVKDDASPDLTITAPKVEQVGEPFRTDESSVILEGEVMPATTGNSPITRLVWDNLNTGESGIITATNSWKTLPIPLKPGKNELLLTALDQADKIDTARLQVNRTLKAPAISNIIVPNSIIGLYEKYEVAFDVLTLADNPFFSYDEQPPMGIAPKIGLDVTAIFVTPSGKTLKQPGFFYTKIEKEGTIYRETAEQHWMVRFAPPEIGEYKVTLQVTDASGTTEAKVGSLNVNDTGKPGFVKVSQADSRYFEYSNGQLFFPVGPAIDSDYALNKNSLNMSRVWLGGQGAYSTNWARWISTADKHGNEGFMAPLTFEQHYPSHELAYRLFCRASCGNNEEDMDGWRIGFGWLDENYAARFKAQATYQVKVRLKTVNITADQAGDNGLTIKLHQWKPDGQTWRAYLSQLPTSHALIPFINTDRDWHTIVTNFTAPLDTAYLSIFLQNSKSGEVYIDEFSVKEIDASGKIISGELIRNAKADMHTTIEQRPAAYLDWQVFQGEQNNVFFKYVVQDKNDWIPNHLTPQGFFATLGGGYYQPNGTKARWLQQQWWRYLIARWGYSRAVQSWELNNEGSPDEPGHYQATQDFAQFMHQNDAHPHLVSTSFWCCWRPKFWGDKQKYGAVDYADLHEYTDNSDLGDKQAQLESDFVALHQFLIQKVKADPVGKPVMRGESGLATSSKNFETLKSTPNPGIWYHNLLWAQLDPTAVFDFNYWWSEHFKQVDQYYFKESRNGASRATISAPFYQFVSSLDLNKGGYGDVAASSDNAEFRVIGQKNDTKAYLWIQNKQHTWKNAMDNPTAITKQSGQVKLKLKPNTAYTITWLDTYAGTTKTDKLTSDKDGQVSLAIQDLENDVAVRIE